MLLTVRIIHYHLFSKAKKMESMFIIWNLFAFFSLTVVLKPIPRFAWAFLIIILSTGNLHGVVKLFILTCCVVSYNDTYMHVVEVHVSSLLLWFLTFCFFAVRTALVALIAFMPTSPNGAMGSVEYPKEERRTLAIKSREAPPKHGSPERQKVIDEVFKDPFLFFTEHNFLFKKIY